jgi:hypothetical protein
MRAIGVATIEHGQRPALSHRSEMFAQSRLEVGDANSLHDYMIVTSGHIVEVRGSQSPPSCALGLKPTVAVARARA